MAETEPGPALTWDSCDLDLLGVYVVVGSPVVTVVVVALVIVVALVGQVRVRRAAKARAWQWHDLALSWQRHAEVIEGEVRHLIEARMVRTGRP